MVDNEDITECLLIVIQQLHQEKKIDGDKRNQLKGKQLPEFTSLQPALTFIKHGH